MKLSNTRSTPAQLYRQSVKSPQSATSSQSAKSPQTKVTTGKTTSKPATTTIQSDAGKSADRLGSILDNLRSRGVGPDRMKSLEDGIDAAVEKGYTRDSIADKFSATMSEGEKKAMSLYEILDQMLAELRQMLAEIVKKNSGVDTKGDKDKAPSTNTPQAPSKQTAPAQPKAAPPAQPQATPPAQPQAAPSAQPPSDSPETVAPMDGGIMSGIQQGGTPSPAATMDAQQLLGSPDTLTQAGGQGVAVTGFQLATGADGKLDAASRQAVNKLIAGVSNQIGREVHASVYKDTSGKLNVHLTAGDHESVTFAVPGGTIYSAHTHVNGDHRPSDVDVHNQVIGADDAVVTPDGRSIIFNQG